MAGTTTNAATPSSGPRPIEARRSLPNGRAVVGALLVTVAAVGTFAVASGDNGGPSTEYLVVETSLRAGSPITDSDVRLEPLELSPAVAAETMSSHRGLAGATVLRDLRPGELLSRADLLPAGSAETAAGAVHELTFPVAVDRVAPGLVPGDRVTVLTTIRTSGNSRTVVATEDALVLSWVAARDGIGSATGVLTLALTDPAEVIATAHLANDGEVTVVRTTRALDAVYPADYVTPAEATGDSLDVEAENPQP